MEALTVHRQKRRKIKHGSLSHVPSGATLQRLISRISQHEPGLVNIILQFLAIDGNLGALKRIPNLLPSTVEERRRSFVEATLDRHDLWVLNDQFRQPDTPCLLAGTVTFTINEMYVASMNLQDIYRSVVPAAMKRGRPTIMTLRQGHDSRTNTEYSRRGNVTSEVCFKCVIGYADYDQFKPNPTDFPNEPSVEYVEHTLAERGSIPGDYLLYKISCSKLNERFRTAGFNNVVSETCVMLTYIQYKYKDYTARPCHMLFPTDGAQQMWSDVHQKPFERYGLQNAETLQFLPTDDAYKAAELAIQRATQHGRAMQEAHVARKLQIEAHGEWKAVDRTKGRLIQFTNGKQPNMPVLINVSAGDWHARAAYTLAVNMTMPGQNTPLSWMVYDGGTPSAVRVERKHCQMELIPSHDIFNKRGLIEDWIPLNQSAV